MDTCQVAADYQKSRFVRHTARDLVRALRLVMYLQRYVPGMETAAVQVLPAIQYVTLGPYTYVSQPVSYLDQLERPDVASVAANCDEGPGDITKVTVRSYNVVDGFQIFYSDGQQCITIGEGGDREWFRPLQWQVSRLRFWSSLQLQINSNNIEMNIVLHSYIYVQ